jgi:phosphate transport system substrate-binding protein
LLHGPHISLPPACEDPEEIFMNKIKIFTSVMFAVMMWVGLVFGQEGQASRVDSLRVGGATTVNDYIESWLPEFEEKNPSIRVVLVASSTGRGLKDLCSGAIDISMASRVITEKDKAEATRAGVDLRIALLERGAIAFIVHPSNPVTELSVEDLAKVFGGKYLNWKELGGPDLPILALISPPDRATGIVVSEEILKTRFSPNAKVISTYVTVAKVVARNPASITYCRSDIALSGSVKPLAIVTGSSSKAVHVSPETIRSGAYPFARPLQLLFDGNKSAHKEAIQRFVEFCVAKAAVVGPK